MKMKQQPNRIHKTEAKKLWYVGKPFVIVPRLIYPFDAKGNLKELAFIVTKQIESSYPSFNTFCDEFAFYNCNSVTGLYPAFYLITDERKSEND